jgi:solute:Na+ symporter, SSS family
MISEIDIALIALYFIALAIVGYRSSKNQTKEDYLICKKKLGVWQNIATLSATKITASVIITYIALVYVFGISAIWIFIGAAIGYLLFLLFAIKLKKEGDLHDYHSVADYFYYRYGLFTGRIVSIVIYLVLFFNFTIQLIGGAKILNSLTALPFIWGVILCSSVVLFYLYLGGFNAVVKTDIVQFVAIIVLFAVLGIFLLSNFSFEATQWNLMDAGPAMILPFLLVGILFPFSAPDLWQRALAAKSVRTLKKSFIFTTSLYISFGILLSLIAMVIRLKMPGIDADVALVQGFVQLLPQGLLGAGLVALFAAIMSSADSFAFICAGLLMHDIFKNDKRSIRSLKWGILITIFLGTIAALFFQSILDASYLLASIFMMFSVVVLATWIKKGIQPITLNFAIFIGLIITLFVGMIMGISATLIVVGILGGLIGLGIGAIISKIILICK